MPNGNRQIVTAIDYIIGQSVTEVVEKADKETVGRFLYKYLFMNYGAPLELISDQDISFISEAVDHYLKYLDTKYYTTIFFHPQINRKIENFNSLIGNILTKLLMNKSIKLWDLYLDIAIFAAQI